MSLRQMLRCWLAWLHCERGPAHPLPVVLALPSHEPIIAPVPLTVSLEALWQRPTITPDRSAYRRALTEAATVNDVATWLVYDESREWWGHAHEACTAAVYWLAMRERVTGFRLT